MTDLTDSERESGEMLKDATDRLAKAELAAPRLSEEQRSQLRDGTYSDATRELAFKIALSADEDRKARIEAENERDETTQRVVELEKQLRHAVARGDEMLRRKRHVSDLLSKAHAELSNRFTVAALNDAMDSAASLETSQICADSDRLRERIAQLEAERDALRVEDRDIYKARPCPLCQDGKVSVFNPDPDGDETPATCRFCEGRGWYDLANMGSRISDLEAANRDLAGESDALRVRAEKAEAENAELQTALTVACGELETEAVSADALRARAEKAEGQVSALRDTVISLRNEIGRLLLFEQCGTFEGAERDVMKATEAIVFDTAAAAASRDARLVADAVKPWREVYAAVEAKVEAFTDCDWNGRLDLKNFVREVVAPIRALLGAEGEGR